jgi:hypothetical protein
MLEIVSLSLLERRVDTFVLRDGVPVEQHALGGYAILTTTCRQKDAITLSVSVYCFRS